MLSTYAGRAGRADLIPLPTEGLEAAMEATLAAWLIDAEGQTPLTRWFQVSLIHLRDIPGVGPAVVRVPGATHEFLVAALDPERNPNTTDRETRLHMTPLNAQVQFVATDELAVHIVEQAVRTICDGKMPAEGPSEHVSRQLWERAIGATLAHHADGKHCDHGHGPG